MAPDSRKRPAAQLSSQARPEFVQPHTDDVPEDWLRDFDDTQEAKRLARLTADVELITRLGLARYEGNEYDEFAIELARYGLAVLSGWMRRGVIFKRMKDRNLGGLPAPPDDAFRDPDVVTELAGETVSKALVHFRSDVLLKNKWDSSRGATIRTYFIGQCLIRFANIYRAWYRHEIRAEALVDDTYELEAARSSSSPLGARPGLRRPLPSGSGGPEAVVVAHREALRGLDLVDDERLKAVLILVGQDLPQKEIALRLGLSLKTVQKMIENHVARVAKKGIA